MHSHVHAETTAAGAAFRTGSGSRFPVSLFKFMLLCRLDDELCQFDEHPYFTLELAELRDMITSAVYRLLLPGELRDRSLICQHRGLK